MISRCLKTLWYLLTLRCEEADRIRSLAQTANPTRAERFGAWSHALVCRGCWIARKQTDKLEKLVGELRGGDQTPEVSLGGGLSTERRNRLAKALEAAADENEK